MRWVPFWGALLFIATGSAFSCGIDWDVPVNYFDGVNEWGYLSYWTKIATFDLGDDLKIPLTIGFNPTRKNSAYLGQGWLLPLLESSFVQLDEKHFLLTQPDGVVRGFWRNESGDAVLHGQGDWMAEIRDNTITAWAACGWKLAFDHGKITAIITPENRKLSYTYGNGLVEKIAEEGRPGLTVDRDSGTEAVTGLSFNGEKVTFELGQKPGVESMAGANVIGHMERSLHKVTSPNGAELNFDFAVNSKLQPTLVVSGAEKRSFTWDPETNTAISDGKWTYSIKQNLSHLKNAAIDRKDGAGAEEFWFNDKVNGREVTLLNGVKKVKTWFTSGVMAGKLRKIEEQTETTSKTLYQADYDGAGNLVRELKDGEAKVYQYDAAGNRISAKFSDGTLVKYEPQEDGSTRCLVSKGNLTFSGSIDRDGNIVELAQINGRK